MNWDKIDLTAPQGWICPICGRVYSPTTPMCFYCGGYDITTTTTHTTATLGADGSIELFCRPRQAEGENNETD